VIRVGALNFERLAFEYLMQLIRNPVYMSLCYRCKYCESIDVHLGVKCRIHGSTFAKLKCASFEKESGADQVKYGTTD
jgi:hypothetical protein